MIPSLFGGMNLENQNAAKKRKNKLGMRRKGFIIAFLLSLFVTEFFSKIQIVISYVNWMFWISIVSLICFTISLLLPELVYAIPMKICFHSYYY